MQVCGQRCCATSFTCKRIFRCLALCDDCRENLASRQSASKHSCPCCRRAWVSMLHLISHIIRETAPTDWFFLIALKAIRGSTFLRAVPFSHLCNVPIKIALFAWNNQFRLLMMFSIQYYVSYLSMICERREKRREKSRVEIKACHLRGVQTEANCVSKCARAVTACLSPSTMNF